MFFWTRTMYFLQVFWNDSASREEFVFGQPPRMILRSFFSSKCSLNALNAVVPTPTRENYLDKNHDRFHSMSENDEEVFFKRYNHQQIFLLELGIAILITLRKTFFLSSKRFRSLYEISSSFFSKQALQKFFWSKHCLSDKFSEKFRPVNWKVFVQPPGPILRWFFSSKSSFGHIECSFHKMTKRMRKTPKLFASMSKSDETFASNKSSFSAKCSLGQLECSVNNSGSTLLQSKWDVFCSRPESE